MKCLLICFPALLFCNCAALRLSNSADSSESVSRVFEHFSHSCDSVVVRDSVFFYSVGDSTASSRVVFRSVFRTLHDTVYQDSSRSTAVIVVEEGAKSPRFSKFWIWFSFIAWLLLVIEVCFMRRRN